MIRCDAEKGESSLRKTDKDAVVINNRNETFMAPPRVIDPGMLAVTGTRP